MRIDKLAFLASTSAGDLPTVQQYLAQPEVASSISALERVLNGGPSTCENLRTTSRTFVAASRGLWFCVGGEWGGVFREAVRSRQVEVLDWFFGVAFAATCPTTVQVVFPHIARQAVAHNDAFAVEALLNSWVFCEAMTPEMREFVVRDLQWMAQADHYNTELLLAHGASEPPDIYGSARSIASIHDDT